MTNQNCVTPNQPRDVKPCVECGQPTYDADLCAICLQQSHTAALDQENVWWRRCLRFPVVALIVVVGLFALPFVYLGARLIKDK